MNAEETGTIAIRTDLADWTEARACLINAWKESKSGLQTGVKLDENLYKFIKWLLDESGLVIYGVNLATALTPLCPRCGKYPLAWHPKMGQARICDRCFITAVNGLMDMVDADDGAEKERA